LAWLGQVALVTGDLDRARELVEESLALEQEMEVKRWTMWRLNHLGLVARFQGETERALSYFEDSLILARKEGDRNLEGWLLHNLGTVALDQGDRELAKAHFKDGLAFAQELGMTRCILFILAEMAALYSTEGQLEQATQLFASVEFLLKAESSPFEPIYQEEYDRNLGKVRTQMNENDFALAWEAGQQMTVQQAIELTGLKD
jgi:ATP/maltotriose-dependent transcriptional regulator MalT